MKRINVRDEEGRYEGWFNQEAATEIASKQHGFSTDIYAHGKVLYHTKSGKLIVNSWGQGFDNYSFAEDEAEISEILSSDPSIVESELNEKLQNILTKYEL